MAVDYAVTKFREWGLEPGGPSGNFFQDLPFIYDVLEKGAIFQVISGKRNLNFHYKYD